MVEITSHSQVELILNVFPHSSRTPSEMTGVGRWFTRQRALFIALLSGE